MRVILRPAFEPGNHRFIPSPWSHCPECGSEDLKRSRRHDDIDPTSHRPMSIFQQLMGGQLYHCLSCRLQFYDLRSLRPAAKS
jgi:hypothetical protein